MRWLVLEREFGGDRESDVRRRRFEIGASGAEAMLVVSLAGGALGGVAGALTQEVVAYVRDRLARRLEHLESFDDRLSDVDDMRRAVAHAFHVRASDFSLVEARAKDTQHAAVFEDTAGRAHGVRVASTGLTIRRLRRDEY